MRSSQQHDFSTVPSIDVPRSSFDRSFQHKTGFDAGYLIPILVDDILPGDTFNVSMHAMCRLSTPQFPLFDNLYLDTHFFFVPLRLVWDNSRKFFGEQANPGDSIDYTIPQFSSFTVTEDSLHDYMNVVPGAGHTINSIYARGYNLIWNEWFRSQDTQNSVVVDTDDGPDTNTDYVLLRRNKRYDYFTSCLPFPQKGDAVTLPLGTSAPITGIGKDTTTFGTAPSPTLQETDGTGSITYTSAAIIGQTNSNQHFYVEEDPNNTGYPNIRADLTNATAATINDLRESFQIQRLLERDARSGTRYSELLRSHYGVSFYDVSYRPTFLGGGSTAINTTPVAQTSDESFSSVTETKLGNIGAFATAAINGHGFTQSFVEHGFIIGLCSLRAELTYQQGVPKHFHKQTRYDIYWPVLSHLGEQTVENQEIYYQNTAADTEAFGYIPRYDEYRYKPNQVSSYFRSGHSATLDPWHLAQEFSSLPVLGSTFLQEDPPVDRVIYSTTEPHCIMDAYISMKCARPLPVNATPGMIDHF